MDGLIVVVSLAMLAVPVLLIIALVSLSGLKRRVAYLESQLRGLNAVAGERTRASPAEYVTPAATDLPRDRASALRDPTRSDGGRADEVAMPPVSTAASAPSNTPSQPPAQRPAAAPIAAAAAMAAEAGSARSMPPPLPFPSPRAPLPPSEPNVVERALSAVKRWFTEGNVPVKIGMLVLLCGVAALLKYASDLGLLVVPVELRLAGIAAAALAALVFGWRQRLVRPSFALAVQGGAIGALLLTVFAAFKLYSLLGAAPAFAISLVLIAGLGVLAVLQDSRTLAVLGILSGFLAPIFFSTGTGSHVALFSYYALLNAAIFGIAWVRPWRALNLLGFVFTWGIGTLWGVLLYDPAKYASTQPFLLLFFAFYLLIPILYAWRSAAQERDRVDGSLLFGTPLAAFSLQAALLDGARMPLALWALGLATLYALLASVLVKRQRFAVLGRAHAMLAIGFATLAVPLALSARATASVFALEGAALVWLGVTQHRRLPRWSGIALQAAAAVALLIGFDAWELDARGIANPTFMGIALIAIAGFASAWVWRQRSRQGAALLYVWGLMWWCAGVLQDTWRFVDLDSRADVLLAVVALTGWMAAEVHRRHPATVLVLTTIVGIASAIPLAMLQVASHAQPFAGNGLWAWLIFAALGVRSLMCLRAVDDNFAPAAQFVWWLVWPTAVSLLANWLAESFALAQGWQVALVAAPWLVLAWVSLSRWTWLSMPLGARFDPLRSPLQAMTFLLLVAGWWTVAALPGSSAPLPWIPLLNPLELAQLATLALLARWLWSSHGIADLSRIRIPLLAVAGFALVTMTTLRAVHHWGGVRWNPGLVSTMVAQTSLTVVWSVLGVAGWIIGSRRGQRALWLSGAVLMGVVLAKLVLVDRQHLGNLLGIGSFIAYGLLCTLVGYFAPAPPRAAATHDHDDDARADHGDRDTGLNA